MEALKLCSFAALPPATFKGPYFSATPNYSNPGFPWPSFHLASSDCVAFGESPQFIRGKGGREVKRSPGRTWGPVPFRGFYVALEASLG